METSGIRTTDELQSTEESIADLLASMTLAEKVGQLCQVDASLDHAPDHLGDGLRQGRIGSVLNAANVEAVNELQRIAVEESRLGIPLLIGRDVIHGFKTVLPIPLGQAASWNPDIVREGAKVAALEAAAAGINWTFAPMIDISRDPRWGRIAESFGEDPYLTGQLGKAAIEGFQGDHLAAPGTIAACAKHFAGYGAAESGRDYATTNIPENELRNVYLPPFEVAVNAGVATIMTSFSDLNGIPATANEFLNRTILRDEWQFDGFVVSDWDSIHQLVIHGLAADDRQSAREAITAGVDMEMAGSVYSSHLESLVNDGQVAEAMIDKAVENILRLKFELGLFGNPYTNPADYPPVANERVLDIAKKAATQSIVMLKNDDSVLPLSREALSSIAVIGPLADAPHQQLGTWIFDGDPTLSVTALDAISDLVGPEIDVHYVRAMQTSRSKDVAPFDEAIAAARQADTTLLFLGEEAILSGEAHSRADIDLPGAQVELVQRIRAAGKPVIAVILAGRPLTLSNVVDHVDAILYAWHPGTMGGPAIADILFGNVAPSGKLPATFPAMVGQVPIYYSQKNTGKPPRAGEIVHIDEIAERAPQTSVGMSAFHLDAGFEPLYPFGFGLSYAEFAYDKLRLSSTELRDGETLTVSVEISNRGKVAAEEIVQLYVRDLVASVTRPVKELKGFRRVSLEPGETIEVVFELGAKDLAFYGRDNRRVTEPGDFELWVGGCSNADLNARFALVDSRQGHAH